MKCIRVLGDRERGVGGGLCMFVLTEVLRF